MKFPQNQWIVEATGHRRLVGIRRLSETKLTWEAGLKHLKALPRLQKLNLDECDISEADLAKLKDELPKVEIIRSKLPTEQQLKWLQERFAKKK